MPNRDDLTDEKELLAALQQDIAQRLRPVCASMSDEAFDEMVREIVAVKLKYDSESTGFASLKNQLSTILDPESGGSGTSNAV